MSVILVGIIGVGQMGNGIVYVMVLVGYDVVLNDILVEVFEVVIVCIDKNMVCQVSCDLIIVDDMYNVLVCIKLFQDVVEIGQIDLVIEVVIENEEIKYKIFEGLVLYLKFDMILILNIFLIFIICFVSCMDWFEKFMGFYFMNLVFLMKFVELI